MEIEKDERVEDLGGGLKVIQNKAHYTFTSDSIILGNFLKLKPKEKAVEIGGGCGVISILASGKNKFSKIKIFEIQEKMQKLCEKNIKINNLDEKIELICDDAKNFKKYLEVASQDVVFSNPPYFLVDSSPSSVRKNARQEVFLNLKELVKISAQMLKYGGRFYLIYPASRLCELIYECEKNDIKIKRMFFTQNCHKVVNLVVIEGKKCGSDGVKILPTVEV